MQAKVWYLSQLWLLLYFWKIPLCNIFSFFTRHIIVVSICDTNKRSCNRKGKGVNIKQKVKIINVIIKHKMCTKMEMKYNNKSLLLLSANAHTFSLLYYWSIIFQLIEKNNFCRLKNKRSICSSAIRSSLFFSVSFMYSIQKTIRRPFLQIQNFIHIFGRLEHGVFLNFVRKIKLKTIKEKIQNVQYKILWTFQILSCFCKTTLWKNLILVFWTGEEWKKSFPLFWKFFESSMKFIYNTFRINNTRS